MRMEPTRSDPYSRNVIPADSAAAAPPEEPPGVRAVSHGLLVAPYSSLAVCPKSPSMKATLVLPMMIAPARLSRWTTVASQSATKSLKAGLPQVVCSPATLRLSLIVMGTPCSGLATGGRFVGGGCFLQCGLGSERNDSVQRRVDAINPREQHLGQLARGDLLAPQHSSRISGRLQQCLVHVAAAHRLISRAVSNFVDPASQR